MGLHDFAQKLEYSQGVRQATDLETIRRLLPGCVTVEKTDLTTDRTGVDYIATLRRGATVMIDGKTREPGASRWWQKDTPEIALEWWSVIAENGMAGKTGWTLSESSPVDYILYTFAPEDCDRVFLYPFQLLRATFRARLDEWQHIYKPKVQHSGAWRSLCLFVPEPVVWGAMHDIVSVPAGHAATDSLFF